MSSLWSRFNRSAAVAKASTSQPTRQGEPSRNRSTATSFLKLCTVSGTKPIVHVKVAYFLEFSPSQPRNIYVDPRERRSFGNTTTCTRTLRCSSGRFYQLPPSLLRNDALGERALPCSAAVRGTRRWEKLPASERDTQRRIHTEAVRRSWYVPPQAYTRSTIKSGRTLVFPDCCVGWDSTAVLASEPCES